MNKMTEAEVLILLDVLNAHAQKTAPQMQAWLKQQPAARLATMQELVDRADAALRQAGDVCQ